MTAGLETFAKVRALHDRSTIPGEKAAAASRMEALARSAGMTVCEAVSKLDAPAPQASGPSFADIFDTPFFREAKAESDRARAEKWRAVLNEYGTEEAVFAPGPWEQALERACERFIVRKPTTGWRIGSLWGWNFVTSRGDPAPEIMDAVKAAYPMPTTVRQAWVEFAFWDKLGRDREARGVGCGDSPDWVHLRVQLVERLLNALPATGLADLRARMNWMDWRNDLETAADPAEERIRLATLRADIERMGERIREQGVKHVQSGQSTNPTKSGWWNCASQGRPARQAYQDGGAQSGQATDPLLEGQCDRPDFIGPVRRTNADKRRAVLALLTIGKSDSDRLTDREIARRAGVSPTTVGTIRRSLA